jgi:hypothetical protein
VKYWFYRITFVAAHVTVFGPGADKEKNKNTIEISTQFFLLPLTERAKAAASRILGMVQMHLTV